MTRVERGDWKGVKSKLGVWGFLAKHLTSGQGQGWPSQAAAVWGWELPAAATS
jgi:hypothetical protein